jgi:hypothetical protein
MGLLGAGNHANTSGAEQAAIARNTNRFLYDTDFWRNKQGWKYTVGTGALDFAVNMGADPAYAGVGLASKAVKGTRSIQIAEAGAKVGVFEKTAEEASRSERVNNFFDWAHGKTAAEIAQHQIWGRGRRINPARDQLSQVFSQADRDEMPLIMRFAAGDNSAAGELVQQNSDLLTQLAKVQDNRVLVDTSRYDTDLFQAMTGAGKELPTRFPLLQEIPPKPVNGTPEQIAGWEKTYGALQTRQTQAAMAAPHALRLRGIGPAARTSGADIMQAEEWKAAKLQELDSTIEGLQAKGQWYRDVLGSVATHPDEFSPGQSNLFGTVKTMYRMGPGAIRDTEAAGTAAIQRMGAGRDYEQLAAAQGPKDFATRLLRNGFYTFPVRAVQAFSEPLHRPQRRRCVRARRRDAEAGSGARP